MIVTLIRIDAQDASGAALPIRLSSHDIPEACHLGGAQWEPALSRLPSFALDFFGGSFSGQVTAPRTGFAFATTGISGFGSAPAARARLADARVRIWVGDITSTATADLGPLTLRFDGRMTGEPEIDEAARVARCEAAVQDAWADRPLLALFAGTGGIEGPAELAGQPKPLVLGNARLCGGVLIDREDNVWMVSNGPVEAISAVYDRLASLGPSAGNFASLAALKAASIPNGSWGTCLAQGLVRLGAPPDGRVSFDVAGSNSGTGGYVRRAGAIIRRIADLAGGTVNAASLSALDAARPYNLQLQLREQVTPREIIARIADSVGAVAGVSLLGELFAQPLAIGTPGEALNADGSSALAVAGVEELAKAAPFWRLATEAELTFEVHSPEEAAFSYRWQGAYSPDRVYRIDDVVTGPDSAAWVYINATPAAGQALPVWPATSNAHWELFQPPGSAAVAPANANLVPFSRMEGDRGWGVNSNPSNLAATTTYGTADGRRFFRASVTATAANQDFSIGAASTSTPQFPLVPGSRVSVQARAETTGVAAGPWRLALWGFTAAGAQSEIASVSGSGLRALSAAALQMFVDVPSNIVGGRLEFYCKTTGAGTFTVALAEPMVTAAASGQTVHPVFSPGPNADDAADVTALAQRTISGPTAVSFTYTSTGALDPSAQMPADLVYTLSNQSGPITSGVTWQYRIIEGNVNGYAASATLRSMSGSGQGTLTISSLGTTSRVEIVATEGGRSVSLFVTLTKVLLPPNSGGSGGAQTANQTSGFGSVSSSSYVTVTNELEVTAGTTTQTVTVNLAFWPPQDNASYNIIEVQVERWNGSAWVAMGSSESATSEYFYDSEAMQWFIYPAGFSFQRTQTITSGTAQKARVRARRSSGTVTHSVTGTLTLSA